MSQLMQKNSNLSPISSGYFMSRPISLVEEPGENPSCRCIQLESGQPSINYIPSKLTKARRTRDPNRITFLKCNIAGGILVMHRTITRNVLTFVNTTAIAYTQNSAFLPGSWHHAIVVVFTNVRTLRVLVSYSRPLCRRSI